MTMISRGLLSVRAIYSKLGAFLVVYLVWPGEILLKKNRKLLR